MRPRLLLLVAVVAFVVAGIAARPVRSLGQPATASPTLGVAEGAINETAPRADGFVHIDSAATIDRLRDLHANTYLYLVEGMPQWDDLVHEFMPAAQRADIQVWAYLVPQTECCSMPYGSDFVQWASAIGSLSRQYPALTGWTIDDMDFSLGQLTPDYIGRMQHAAHAFNPQLQFYAELYAPAVTAGLVARYRQVIDGVILPYRDDPYRNTEVTASFRSQMKQFSTLLHSAGLRPIVMLYANTLSGTPSPPTVSYVRDLTKIALADTRSGELAGTIEWNLELAPGQPPNAASNRAHTGNGWLSLAAQPSIPIKAGWATDAQTTLRLDPGSTTCAVGFWQTDNRSGAGPQGVQDKQLLVGDRVIWTQDVSGDPAGDWQDVPPIDVTSAFSGTTARLDFRLLEQQPTTNYSTYVTIDDLTTIGCHVADPSFEGGSDWSVSGHGPMMATVANFDPTFTSDVFNAVRAAYNSYEPARPSIAPARATAAAEPRSVSAAYSRSSAEFVLAAAGDAIRDQGLTADGYQHVDTPRTLQRLVALGANTYLYKISQPSDWADLTTRFLPAAEQSGIDIWVELAPPGGCRTEPCSLPYRADYQTWGREIGTLAAHYGNLTGWVIDHATDNLDSLTPAVVTAARDAARAHDPELPLYLGAYVPAVTTQFAAQYRSAIDGLIVGYRDDPTIDQVQTASLPAQLTELHNTMGATPVFLSVYPQLLAPNLDPPTVAYVRTVTQIGIRAAEAGTIAGLVETDLPLAPGITGRYESNKAYRGNGRLSLNVADHRATTAGQHADASTTLERGGTCALSFRYADDVGTTYPEGYHIVQALIDGKPVWSHDVAADPQAVWTTVGPIRIDADSGSVLTFRLLENQGVGNYAVDASIDDVRLGGCAISNGGYERTAGWRLSSTSSLMSAFVDIFDPIYSTHAFDAVATLYHHAASQRARRTSQ